MSKPVSRCLRMAANMHEFTATIKPTTARLSCGLCADFSEALWRLSRLIHVEFGAHGHGRCVPGGPAAVVGARPALLCLELLQRKLWLVHISPQPDMRPPIPICPSGASIRSSRSVAPALSNKLSKQLDKHNDHIKDSRPKYFHKPVKLTNTFISYLPTPQASVWAPTTCRRLCPATAHTHW